jgi:hypothetical protein
MHTYFDSRFSLTLTEFRLLFPSDIEVVGSSYWADVPYYRDERISCSNLDFFKIKKKEIVA